MNVFDSSVLLAFLKKEKGWQVVKKEMDQAVKKMNSIFIHQINFIEVLYYSLSFYGEQKTKNIVAELESPYLAIVNYFDNNLAFYTSYLKSHYPISLGDAVGLAYAKIMEGTFWTADKALEPVARKEKIKISLIR